VKRSTKVIAWVWTLVMGASVIHNLFDMVRNLAVGRGIGINIGLLLLLAGGIGLVERKSYGWWLVLTVCIAMVIFGTISLTTQWGDVTINLPGRTFTKTTNPGVCAAAVTSGMILFGAIAIALVMDRPSRWRRRNRSL
jgi:hypothetical protein